MSVVTNLTAEKLIQSIPTLINQTKNVSAQINHFDKTERTMNQLFSSIIFK